MMNSSDCDGLPDDKDQLLLMDDQKVDDDDERTMYEGKNIHTSPTDGKLLCSYSQKLCKQRRLNGYAFCIRHVLEDKSCPFKQCQYVAKYNGQQCTNPIPKAEDRIYCNSHLQVLGMKPKKSRKRKSEDIQSSLDSEPEGVVFKESKSIKSNKSKANKKKTKLDKCHERRHHRQQQRHHHLKQKPSKVKIKHEQKKVSENVKKSSIRKVEKKKKVKAKKKIALAVKYPSVKIFRDIRRKQQKLVANILLSDIDYLSSSDEEESESMQLDYDHYWQKSYLDQNSDITSDGDCDDVNYLENRAKRVAALRLRLRREVFQIARYTKQNIKYAKVLDRYIKCLVKIAKESPHLAARILSESDASMRLQRHRSVIIRCCYMDDDEDTRCSNKALPYSKYCDMHILFDDNQVLYSPCTAKYPGGILCAKTTLDFINEKPLCEEHIRKKSMNNNSRGTANGEAKGKKRIMKAKVQTKKPKKTSKEKHKSSKKNSEKDPPCIIPQISDSRNDLLSHNYRTPTPHTYSRLSPVLPEYLSNLPSDFHALDPDMLFDIANGKNGELGVTPEEVAAVLAQVAMEGASDPLMSAPMTPTHAMWSSSVPARMTDYNVRGSLSPRTVAHNGINQSFTFDNSVISQQQSLNDNEMSSVCDIGSPAFIQPQIYKHSAGFVSDSYPKNYLNNKRLQASPPAAKPGKP